MIVVLLFWIPIQRQIYILWELKLIPLEGPTFRKNILKLHIQVKVKGWISFQVKDPKVGGLLPLCQIYLCSYDNYYLIHYMTFIWLLIILGLILLFYFPCLGFKFLKNIFQNSIFFFFYYAFPSSVSCPLVLILNQISDA